MLIRLSIAWLAGIALAAWVMPPFGALVAGCGLAGGLIVVVRRRIWQPETRLDLGLVASLGLCAVLGGLRYEAGIERIDAGHIARHNGQSVTLRGRIVAEPDRRDRQTNYRVAVDAVEGGEGWAEAHGQVLVQGTRYPPHAYGELVRVTGALEEPPVLEGFDYRAYLARKGMHSLVKRPKIETLAAAGGNPVRRALLAIKERARLALAASVPEPEAALLTGILLGDDNGIPDKVDAAFRTTNTTHVIAISGSNISLLVVVLMISLGRLLGRRRAVPAILVVLALYSALVGADAAVVRAAIMGGIMVMAGFVGRPGHAATALFAAAWAMTLYQPYYLWDLGFQLSFAATLGLIVFTSRFGEGLEALLARRVDADRARAWVKLVNEAVIVTLAAQLTTWPLIAYNVGQVSLAGLVANFLILPAQPAVMMLGALATIMGMAWPSAGTVLGALAWLPTAYTIRAVELTARLPMAAVAWQMPGWMVVAYYVGLGVLVIPRERWVGVLGRTAVRPYAGVGMAMEDGGRAGVSRAVGDRRERVGAVNGTVTRAWAGMTNRLGLGVLAVLCALAWAAAVSQPDGLLHVIALDVGQGDAILVLTPNGRRMLVDGGPSSSAVLDGLGRHFAPWDRRLDVVVLTHPDADHVGGLAAVLERYEVGAILDPELEAHSPDAQAWQDALEHEGAELVRAAVGERLVLDDASGVEAEVLWPPDERLAGTDADTNNNAVVLRLRYGRIAALLTGDIEEPAERGILQTGRDLRADMLKVAHHGSDGSSTEAFVHAVDPALAVISVGADNKYGHPAEGALTRLRPAVVRRTDQQGEVEVMSDGEGLWVR